MWILTLQPQRVVNDPPFKSLSLNGQEGNVGYSFWN